MALLTSSSSMSAFGARVADYQASVQRNRQVEEEVRTRRGRKWPYGQIFYTEDIFGRFMIRRKSRG